MRETLDSARRLSVTLVAASLLTAGCATGRKNWTMIPPHAPAKASVAVGINPQGVTWFFECDAQSVMSGMRIRKFEAPDGLEKTLTIQFDTEPAEESAWLMENSTYVMRGDAATRLARRAALAYHAVLTIEGKPIRMALTGSHAAMIDMTRNCPFLEVTG